MNKQEALTRIKTGNFNGDYGFDMQLLIDTVGIIGEMFKNGQISETATILKEREPQPIEYIDNFYTGIPIALCPKCRKSVRQFHSTTIEETHYCPWCGQAVKWNA